MVKRWAEKSRETAFSKYGRGVDKVIFELPDGTESDFYLNTVRPAACMVGLTKTQEVITVEQYRPGPDKVLRELPGGYININESPAEAAAREFLEETGYKGTFTYVGSCLDDAYSNMERHIFVASDCEKVGDPKNTSTEITHVLPLTLTEFRNHLRSGLMTDVEVGYLALDHLGLL